MQYEVSRQVDAAPAVVWSVLADIRRWPTWTASIRSADPLDHSVLAQDAAVRIKQPRTPAMVWRVTQVDAGRSFTWRTHGAGVTSTATHRVTPQRDGTSFVQLGVRYEGPLAPVVARLLAGRTRRFLQLEADGLKRRSEQMASGRAAGAADSGHDAAEASGQTRPGE